METQPAESQGADTLRYEKDLGLYAVSPLWQGQEGLVVHSYPFNLIHPSHVRNLLHDLVEMPDVSYFKG